MKKPKANPTLQDFYDFLEIHFHGLEGLGRVPKHGQIVSHHLQATDPCLCGKGNHFLANSSKIAKLKITLEVNIIRKN